MENINLCKILKGYEGKTFYSPLIGETVILGALNIEEETIEIYINEDERVYLYPDGTYYRGGECMLFPSKDQRDWNKWVEEQKTKAPKTWNELVTTNKANSHCIHTLNDTYLSSSKSKRIIEKSALALLKIHQLIEVGYGGNVINEEWRDYSNSFYTIVYNNEDDKYVVITAVYYKSHIVFHTKEQAEEFLKYPENIQLLKDYFMI